MPAKASTQLTLFGIRPCDTCRKAQSWLKEHSVEFEFHDIRTDGLEPELLDAWLASALAPLLVNRRSTTWRGLSAAEKARSESAAANLLLRHPTLLKRPLLQRGNRLLAVGFTPDEYKRLLQS